MSGAKCPQCGAGPFGSSCPRCHYSASVCPAGARSGHRGMDPFRWVKFGAALPVVFLLFGLSNLSSRSKESKGANDTKPAGNPSAGVTGGGTSGSPLTPGSSLTPGGRPAAGNGTLQLRFPAEANLDGVEVFLDGKVAQLPGFGFSRQATLRAAPGPHTVAVHLRGKVVFSRPVEVKPADRGVLTLDVPAWEDVTAPGTLQVQIESVDGWPSWADGLEMFIDGKLAVPRFVLTRYSLMQPAGEHAVLLKKNGIEVYSSKVQVKKPVEGKTYLKVDLVVTGSVVVRNVVPIDREVKAYVDVDGKNASQWKVGSRESPELKAEVGSRVVRVYTRKPFDRVWQTFRVEVKPGMRHVLELKPR